MSGSRSFQEASAIVSVVSPSPFEAEARRRWIGFVSEDGADAREENDDPRLIFLEADSEAPGDLSRFGGDFLGDADRARWESMIAPARRFEFLLGRWALHLLKTGSPDEGSWTTSLSHTQIVARTGDGTAEGTRIRHACVAVGLRTTGRVQVGVDLERFDRPVSAKVLRRLVLEPRTGVTPISEWTVREALWKANPVVDDHKGILAHYQPVEGRDSYRGPDPEGSVAALRGCSFPLGQHWQMAFALGSRKGTR